MRFIRSGYGEPEVDLGTERIRICTEDGHIAMELELHRDGSLMVRGVDTFKFGDQLRRSSLVVRPHVSNVVHITNDLY